MQETIITNSNKIMDMIHNSKCHLNDQEHQNMLIHNNIFIKLLILLDLELVIHHLLKIFMLLLHVETMAIMLKHLIPIIIISMLELVMIIRLDRDMNNFELLRMLRLCCIRNKGLERVL